MSQLHFPLPVSAVAIDLDGTLLDTLPDLAAAANRTRADFGLPDLPGPLLRTFIGQGISNLVRRTLAGSKDGSVDADTLARGLEIFEAHYDAGLADGTRLYPQVREGLDALHALGLPLACITNKAARFTLPLLACMDLAKDFRLVVSGDTLPVKKPHPGPLLHVAEAFGVFPTDLLLIGDSVHDTGAARAAGSPVFVVTYGYHDPEADGAFLDADAHIASLVEGARLLARKDQPR